MMKNASIDNPSLIIHGVEGFLNLEVITPGLTRKCFVSSCHGHEAPLFGIIETLELYSSELESISQKVRVCCKNCPLLLYKMT